MASSSSFPATGTILIESELITYTGNSGGTLSGLTRGANGTTAAIHSSVVQPLQMQQTFLHGTLQHLEIL